MKHNLSMWLMTMSLPPDGKRTYTTNRQVRVLASDIYSAIRAAEIAHPGGTVWSASHQGTADLVAPID